MAATLSPGYESPEEYEEDAALAQEGQWLPDEQHGIDRASSSVDVDAAVSQDRKPPPPMQKRRRVTRACDECRRKKIKCDGKQPCTHCTVYSYGQ